MKNLPDEQEKVQHNMKSEVPMTKHEKEGQLGEEKEYPICDTDDSGLCISPENHPSSEEKKDWEESFRRKWEGANTGGHNAISTPVMDEIIEDIHEKLKEEREALLYLLLVSMKSQR